MRGATMGRPKKHVKGAAPVKRIAIQATVDWVEWLERGAKHCRTDISKLLDVAVARYLRAEGFDDPPPDRVP